MDLHLSEAKFHSGTNLAIKRGTRWASVDDAFFVGIHCFLPIRTVVMRFCDLRDADVKQYHACEGINTNDLLDMLSKDYDFFSRYEVVTLVYFDVPEPLIKASTGQ